jgi:hypothetical protein
MKMTRVRATFAVCVNNKGYPVSLEVGKLYRVIPDDEAESHGYLRVVDESGEDYAYSSERFFPLEIPTRLKRALRAVPANRTTQRSSTRAKSPPGPRPGR